MNSHPVLDDPRLLTQKRDLRLVGGVCLCSFLTMFTLAFALPASFNEMLLIREFVVGAREWLPNVHLVAVRAAQPDRVEAFLVIGLVINVLSFLTFIVWRPSSRRLPPLKSWDEKVLMVLLLSLAVAIISAVWWNPAIAEFATGPGAGRLSRAIATGLSGPVGTATVLNVLFCLGPLTLAVFLWLFLTRPVAKLREFPPGGASGAA